ncbi:MAG: hypothetical protein K8T26_01620 [Lentisphaerae bacterium]|nr:hypothetical protein [Lentisphaerota bacterium]
MKISLGKASSTEELVATTSGAKGELDHLRKQSQQDRTQEMGGGWSKQGCSCGKSKDLWQNPPPNPQKHPFA